MTKLETELQTTKDNNLMIIGNHLVQLSLQDDVIKENINKENKSLKECWEFITKEAKEYLKGKSGGIKDEMVFGWAIHYYDEDDIEIEKPKNVKPIKQDKQFESKNVETPKEVKEVKPVNRSKKKTAEGQLSIFDL